VLAGLLGALRDGVENSHPKKRLRASAERFVFRPALAIPPAGVNTSSTFECSRNDVTGNVGVWQPCPSRHHTGQGWRTFCCPLDCLIPSSCLPPGGIARSAWPECRRVFSRAKSRKLDNGTTNRGLTRRARHSGRTACNGWRFWTPEGDPEGEVREGSNGDTSGQDGEAGKAPPSGARPEGGWDDGQVCWFCSGCMKSFVTESTEDRRVASRVARC
jgi:hypothetical protein